MGDITIRVEADCRTWHGDHFGCRRFDLGSVADLDAGLVTSRLMAAAPHEMLTYISRGTSARDYHRLKAALDRLQSTTIATSIRQPAERRMHRFSWITEWKERVDANNRPQGIGLILPDWFYSAVLDDALVLTIDRAYFALPRAMALPFGP
jgi:plasmid replication initiation protein